MATIIETDLSVIIPTIEIEGDDDHIKIITAPGEALTPSDNTISKMDSYDEDLNANPFFQSFMATCPDLFSQCVQDQWIICVPRRDSLPKYAFTLEDFAHHILRPLSKRVQRQYSGDSDDGLSSAASNCDDTELSFNSRSNSSCSGSSGSERSFTVCSPFNSTFLTNLAVSTSFSNISTKTGLKGHWNFRTLSHVNVEYTGTTLTLDIEMPICKKKMLTPVKPKEAVRKLSSSTHLVTKITPGSSLYHSPSSHRRDNSESQGEKVQLRKEVLFEETFYTTGRQKYKVLCVASPLNSKVDIDDANFGNDGLGIWNLTSLRDCIDFLWVKASPKILYAFDANIKLFQHNHRGLENFPLKVQKDLVHTLYLKCLNFAITNGSVIDTDSPENVALNEFILQRLKIATETYVLNGIYRSLISAITSFVSAEDAKLNKVMRNLTELHPQDLDIQNVHWDNLARARIELGRINSYSSPLGKLTCMKRTLRYLRPEPYPDMEGCLLSADELIPIWVYLVVKNPLGNWMGQLEFLRHFRFSAEEQKDNENSFYITTLEASLEHLRSGKVLGISEMERDTGMPCDLGEAWLHCVHSKAMESTDSPLGEMFDVIRLGNCPRLEELFEDYEIERKTKINEPTPKSIDMAGLCHPLCQCERCVKFMRKNTKNLEEKMGPAVLLKTNDGLTMLHVACIYGRPKIVEFLIDAGADLEAQDVDGMAALHFAASRGHQNALLLLLDAGAMLEPRNCTYNTPLHLAAQNGHEGCIKALIYDAERCGRKMHLSARNQKGDTPLHFASRWGFQGIVQILVEHGAAIRIHNVRHVTPLDCAHDIHILKILQRSLRRRSLVEINHGDFVNIEMVQKEECGGIVMLITEPKSPKVTSPEKSPSGDNSRSGSRNQSRGPSRKTSSILAPEMISASSVFLVGPGIRSRKASSVINPMKEINEETSKCLQEVADHLGCVRTCHENFVQNNNDFMNLCENEHIRKISVQSLEDCRVASAESVFSGMMSSEDTKQHDIRKIFTAILHQDFPLALFYLGIPAEELTSSENDTLTPTQPLSCHPLCPCTRCVAKNAGLGLGLDVKNSEGYTPLHFVVLNHLPTLLKILIRFGADVNCQSTNDKKTALDIAKEKGFHDMEDILENCGASSTTSFTLEAGLPLWGVE